MSFSHLDKSGNPAMVDVSSKSATDRTAIAISYVDLPEPVIAAFQDNDIQTKKGPVFQTAIIAGIQAAKNTSNLIPMCHPLPLEKCSINIEMIKPGVVEVRCMVKVHHKTGVEMEALTGASVAALTIYDMCKGLSHDIVIRDIQLLSKKGGKHDVDRTPQETR